MKLSHQFTRLAKLSTIALSAGTCFLLPAGLHAAGPSDTPQKPGAAQRLFASPEEAVKALQAATAAKDQAALTEIFGPEFHELLTGDKVQDANHQQKFAADLAQGCVPVTEGADKITFEIGTN